MSQFVFHDVDEAVQTIAHESLQYRQLDSGQITINLLGHELDDLSIFRVRLDKRVDGTGSIEQGRIYFELSLGGQGPHLFSGQDFGSGKVYLAAGNGGGHQLLKPGYDSICLSFCEKAMARHAACPILLPAEGQVLAICPNRFSQLVLLGQEFIWGQVEGAAGRELVDRMGMLVSECLPESTRDDRAPLASGARAKLAGLAREMLVECREKTLVEICDSVGLSGRALRRIFSEVYGISPLQYRLAVQLSKVRQDLKRSPPEKGFVAKVAARHGFWHMGRFGCQYRRQYGESPSETLQARSTGALNIQGGRTGLR
jgi:AraC family ethanolamine operon transcriptional activator